MEWKGLMKIEKLEIREFKLFQNSQLEFEPDLNVLAGVNGSGKTTILE
ncbi:MAG: AAA family ATPase [Campylobacterales bacterium]